MKSIFHLSQTDLYRVFLAALVVLAVSFSACKPDDDVDPPVVEVDYRNGALVLNEGKFNEGNASVDFIDADSGTVTSGIFTLENERPLGDVLHSITLEGEKAYLIVNNSGNIEVVDRKTFASLGTVTGLSSPRYMSIAPNGKAFVTDLFSGSVALLDLVSMTVEQQIPTGGWTEDIKTIQGLGFACKAATDQILILDPDLATVIDSIQVGRGPLSMVTDMNGKLWVLCDGGWQETFPSLVRIDPATRMVEASFNFDDVMESPSKLRISADGNTLYWLNSSVFKMGISETSLPIPEFIPAGPATFYGLGVHPVNGEVYVLDAGDFASKGTAQKFTPGGAFIQSFQTGVVPGGVSF